MLVQELMTSDPVTVRTHTTIKAALVLLDEHGITSLPVVGASGAIVGVVSEADLIRDAVGPDPRTRDLPFDDDSYARCTTVGEVMSPHAVTVRPDTDIVTAVELATSTGIKSLPVVDARDRVVGIISRRDVVRMLAHSDERIEAEVDALLASAGSGDWLVEAHDGVAELTGPDDPSARRVASVLARSVPGVLEVRFP